jgi:hypothetical protein
MPIITTNKLVVKSQEPEPPVRKVEAPAPAPRIYKDPEKPTIESITEPSVVVNGKVKKISKKSAFLLDMLSLDD